MLKQIPLTIILVFLLGQIFGQNQSRKGNVWQMLPYGIDSNAYPTILGIRHADIQWDTMETVYTDTELINSYFAGLAERVDPKNVVLIVEQPEIAGCHGEIMQTPSVWITPAMRQMGYTKWLPADNRTIPKEKHMKYLEYLSQIANLYFKIRLEDSLDAIGYHCLSVIPDIPLSELVEQVTMLKLTAVSQTRDFERHLLAMSDSMTSKSYVPVIVSGLYHPLAIGRPCCIQMQNTPEGRELVYRNYCGNKVFQKMLEYFENKYQVCILPISYFE